MSRPAPRSASPSHPRRRPALALGAALAVAASLAPRAARASLDTYGLGQGMSVLNVTRANTVINRYAALSASVRAGSSSVPVAASTGFNDGDLVLVWQVGSLTPAPAAGTGDAPVTLAGGVGRWELARVRVVQRTSIELVEPLLHDYARGTTQVVRVPEFTDVNISSGASLVAGPWDGASGGVLAFFARGTVTLNGNLNASGTGFRGGVGVNDPRDSLGCTGLTEAAPRGAQRGESVGADAFGPTQTGRGAVANGGGGGVCHNSGGGGGGHGGRGGRGGFSYLEARTGFGDDGGRNVGGYGGAALQYSLLERMSFGGGGGAGHINNMMGRNAGRGGGLVFFRAGTVRGTGAITADGETPAQGGFEGMGGGGAGGAIIARVRDMAQCGRLSARGGNGGSSMYDTRNAHGPGGGGGGGLVLLQSAGGACTPDVRAGVAGTQPGPSPQGPNHGAQGTDGAASPFAGAVQRANPGGFRELRAPAVTSPMDMGRTDARRPEIVGTADPNVTVVLIVDGVEVGRVMSDARGNFRFTPTRDLSVGGHTVIAQSTTGDGSWSNPSAAVRFTIGDTTDTDMDGLPDSVETMLGTDPRNPDTDGDGIPDGNEVPDPARPRDTNGNGTIDARDPDDDGDGVPTRDERPGGRDRDTDMDGLPDFLDPDDDGDSLPTRDERMLDMTPDDDFDADGLPSYLDEDADGDGVNDRIETMLDTDRDGAPDFLDLDSDNDCLPDASEPGAERVTPAAMPDASCAGSPLGPVCDTMRGVCGPCTGPGCPMPDGGTTEPDGAVGPGPDAATMEPDVIAPPEDTGTTEPDASTPAPDASSTERDASMPDAAAPDEGRTEPTGRLSGGGLIACAVAAPGAPGGGASGLVLALGALAGACVALRRRASSRSGRAR